MELLFILCIGIVMGILVVVCTQFSVIQKRKYGYSQNVDFDFSKNIDTSILEINKNDQHANKE